MLISEQMLKEKLSVFKKNNEFFSPPDGKLV